MIKIGTAGIPIRCKGRSSAEGILCVKDIGLQAMEVEFVRGVHMKNDAADELRKVAEKSGIALSAHAPYYINLSSEEKIKISQSKKRILDSMERAQHMGAKIVVVHPGYYGKMTKEQCFKMIKEGCEDIVSRHKGDVILGLETTAKERAFGDLDEIIRICKEVSGCAPVIDFAHMFARTSSIDYADILKKVSHFKHIHSHFSNMKKTQQGGHTDIHVPIDSAPPFKPLAEQLMKQKTNITIISESPLIEADALKMKHILESLGYKF